MNKLFLLGFSLLFAAAPLYSLSLNKIKTFGGAPAHLTINSRGGYYTSGAAYSPDGKILYIASGSQLLVCDADNGKELARHKLAVRSLEISKDGDFLLGSGNGKIILWYIKQAKTVIEIDNLSRSRCSACFSADEKQAVCVNNGILQIYDLSNGKKFLEFKFPDPVRSINFAAPSPDGKGIYLSLTQGKDVFRFYDLNAKKIIRIYRSTFGYRAYPSPDGKLLIASNYAADFFDPATGRKLGRSRGFHERFRTGSYLPDGRMLAASFAYAYILDPGKYDYVRYWPLGKHIAYVQASPDGKYFCFSDTGRGIFGQCSVADGKDRKNWERPNYYAKYLTVGKKILVALETDYKIVVRAPDGKIMREIINKSGPVTSLALSPDNKRVIAGSLYGTLDEYEINSGKHLLKIAPEGHRQSGLLRSVRYFADGKRIACGGGNGIVYVRSLANGKIMCKLSGHVGGIFSVDISPDQQRIISSGFDQTIREWNLKNTGELKSMLLVGYSRCVRYLPDAQVLAAGKYGLARINFASSKVSVYSKKQAKILHSTGDVCVSFSPDSKYVLMTDGNNLAIYPTDGKNSFKKRLPNLNSVVFTPQGDIISTSRYASYTLWKIKP